MYLFNCVIIIHLWSSDSLSQWHQQWPRVKLCAGVWPWLRRLLLDHENNGILMFCKGQIHFVASTQNSSQISPWASLLTFLYTGFDGHKQNRRIKTFYPISFPFVAKQILKVVLCGGAELGCAQKNVCTHACVHEFWLYIYTCISYLRMLIMRAVMNASICLCSFMHSYEVFMFSWVKMGIAVL
jgi:hypothetical protein